MVAIDKRNGKELWRASREERSSWSTPLAVEHDGRTEIVVSATNKVRSYDPETGKVLWESAGLGANVIPVPVHQSGVVYVMSGYRDPKLMAIKLGRKGDLTGSDAIVWSHTRGLRLHRLARALRRQALRCHGQRHDQRVQRYDWRTLLRANSSAEELQLESVACGCEREVISGN